MRLAKLYFTPWAAGWIPGIMMRHPEAVGWISGEVVACVLCWLAARYLMFLYNERNR